MKTVNLKVVWSQSHLNHQGRMPQHLHLRGKEIRQMNQIMKYQILNCEVLKSAKKRWMKGRRN